MEVQEQENKKADYNASYRNLYLCALYSIVSFLAVGTAIIALPPGLTKHQAFAIVTKSPHGCKASPNLPKPACSMEL